MAVARLNGAAQAESQGAPRLPVGYSGGEPVAAGLDEAWRSLRLAFASGRITERLYDTLADVLARREAALLGM